MTGYRQIILVILSLILAACSPAVQEDGVSAEKYPQLELLDEEEKDPLRLLALSRESSSSETYPLKADNKIKSRKKDYTLMIYMCGSDLESGHGAATAELQEMCRQNIDFRKLNVIVCCGGTKTWRAAIPSTRNTVIDLSKGMTGIVARTDKSSNMGAAESLADFINFTAKNYPAKQYGLIFWDHGGGPLWGCCGDELFQNDALTLQEMKTALEQTPFRREHLDFVGFDACLMGNLEAAEVWSSYADYYIASEEVEPGSGWNYAFLSQFGRTKDTRRIHAGIVDAYAQACEAGGKHTVYTLAVYDLSKIGDLIRIVDDLSKEVTGKINGGEYSEVARAFTGTRSVGNADVSSSEYGMSDLGAFVSCLNQTAGDTAEAYENARKSFVVKSAASSDIYSGISLYFPDVMAYQNYGEFEKDFLISEAYGKMLTAYYAQYRQEDEALWALEDFYETEDAYCLDLTEYQIEHLAFPLLHVWQNYDSEDENAVTNGLMNSEKYIELDGNTLKISKDPEVFMIHSGSETSDYVFPAIQVGRTGGRQYSNELSRLGTDEAVVIFPYEKKYMRKVSIGIRETGDEVIVDSILENGSVLYPGTKNTIDVSDNYRALQTWLPMYYVQETSPGNYEYVYAEKMGIETMPIGSEMTIDTRPISQICMPFSYQVCLKDIYGNVHRSTLRPYHNMDQKTVIKDGIQFYREEDHYIVIGADDETEVLRIPDEINGLKVTAVHKAAFSKNKTLKEVILPDTVTEIGDSAFAFTNISAIHLGTGLGKIGYAAFYDCLNLEHVDFPESLTYIARKAFCKAGLTSISIPEKTEYLDGSSFSACPITEAEVDPQNSFYKSTDNVIFTQDMKKLVLFPRKCVNKYAVPAGTETVGHAAFEHTEIELVSFPDSLKTIEDHAFHDCFELRNINLPESVVTIGDYAFDQNPLNLSTGYYFEGDVKIPEVHIGKNTEYIGCHAFDGKGIEGFTVDEDNPYYADLGGFITDKTQSSVLFAPFGMYKDSREVHIPDGITTLPAGTFEYFRTGLDYYLPPSLYRISFSAFTSHNGGEEENTYHCEKGSAAEQYSILKGFPCALNDEKAVREEKKPSKPKVSGKSYAGENTYWFAEKLYTDGLTMIYAPHFPDDDPENEMIFHMSAYRDNTYLRMDGSFLDMAQGSVDFVRSDGVCYLVFNQYKKSENSHEKNEVYIVSPEELYNRIHPWNGTEALFERNPLKRKTAVNIEYKGDLYKWEVYQDERQTLILLYNFMSNQLKYILRVNTEEIEDPINPESVDVEYEIKYVRLGFDPECFAIPDETDGYTVFDELAELRETHQYNLESDD